MQFGVFDGEEIAAAEVRLVGGGQVDGTYQDGDRVVLSVEGTVGPSVAIRRVSGRLVRVASLRVEKIAEPADALADEIADHLQAVDDARVGRQALPFDGDEAGNDGDDE